MSDAFGIGSALVTLAGFFLLIGFIVGVLVGKRLRTHTAVTRKPRRHKSKRKGGEKR